MDKEAVVHIYNGVLLSHNIWVSSNEEDEPRTYNTKWSQKEKNKYHILMYKWNLERWYWWTFLQGGKGDTDIENRLVDTVGEGDGGMNWETSIEISTHVYFLDSSLPASSSIPRHQPQKSATSQAFALFTPLPDMPFPLSVLWYA